MAATRTIPQIPYAFIVAILGSQQLFKPIVHHRHSLDRNSIAWSDTRPDTLEACQALFRARIDSRNATTTVSQGINATLNKYPISSTDLGRRPHQKPLGSSLSLRSARFLESWTRSAVLGRLEVPGSAPAPQSSPVENAGLKYSYSLQG